MRHYVILTVVIFCGLLACDAYKFDGRNRQAAWQDVSSFGSRPANGGKIFRIKCSANSTQPCRSLTSLALCERGPDFIVGQQLLEIAYRPLEAVL